MGRDHGPDPLQERIDAERQAQGKAVAVNQKFALKKFDEFMQQVDDVLEENTGTTAA